MDRRVFLQAAGAAVRTELYPGREHLVNDEEVRIARDMLAALVQEGRG